MPHSILEAIRLGKWDYEPEPCEEQSYHATSAMPGSEEKLEVLCDRVRRGLPLWHPGDRRTAVEFEHDDDRH